MNKKPPYDDTENDWDCIITSFSSSSSTVPFNRDELLFLNSSSPLNRLECMLGKKEAEITQLKEKVKLLELKIEEHLRSNPRTITFDDEL